MFNCVYATGPRFDPCNHDWKHQTEDALIQKHWKVSTVTLCWVPLNLVRLKFTFGWKNKMMTSEQHANTLGEAVHKTTQRSNRSTPEYECLTRRIVRLNRFLKTIKLTNHLAAQPHYINNTNSILSNLVTLNTIFVFLNCIS